eukprot:13404429-Alexandrium_andersonii.AAC.1
MLHGPQSSLRTQTARPPRHRLDVRSTVGPALPEEREDMARARAGGRRSGDRWIRPGGELEQRPLRRTFREPSGRARLLWRAAARP